MIAYKFLDLAGKGRFSGFVWIRPAPGSTGAWVEAEPVLCASGIHACRARDLPFWFDTELWRIELDGPIVEANRKVIAGRGRLVGRVVSWDEAAARDFSTECADRACSLAGGSEALSGYVADALANVESGLVATVAYIAARIAELVGGVAGYEAERATQVRWLADRLGLDAGGR
ncbi:MAG: hypothetical protein ABI927_03745 [Gaiellaceae bacterium]